MQVKNKLSFHKIRIFLSDLKNRYNKYRIVLRERKEVNGILKTIPNYKRLQDSQNDIIQNYYIEKIGRQINTLWHTLYLEGEFGFDSKYIPVDILFTEIIPKLNVSRFNEAYADKSGYEALFPCISHPINIMKMINGSIYVNGKIISKEVLRPYLPETGISILKPTLDTSRGNGVRIINWEDIDSQEKLNALLERSGDNFIIQEKIESHEVIKNLNSSSLNTLRIVSYRKDNDVYILSTTLKIGKSGSIVDNGHHGGYFCGVTDDGRLKKYLYTLNPFKRSRFTENGVEIEGIMLPNFDKIKSIVKQCALRLPYARYVGWDIGIRTDGEPVLIEINLRCPGGNIMQIPNGPLFGDYTDEILEEVF